MNVPAISVGEGVTMARRSFVEDERCHFLGTVTACSDSIIRVEGHAVVTNAIGSIERRPASRTRIFSIATGVDVVLLVPAQVDVDELGYQTSFGRLLITDGSGCVLDSSEFGRSR